jgi:prolyl-tRNA editing enzyme YbaK/EbsC (Cys-tRNA(Pro) deacylase)
LWVNFGVILRFNDRLKYSKIVKLLGINRNDLKMCDPKVLVEKYGYEIGSLSPIKVYGDITIIIDKRIYEFEYIVCGVGISTKTLKINVLDLLKEPSNIIADII